MARIFLAVGLACLLVGCPRVRPLPAEKGALPAIPAPDLRGAVLYDVNPQESAAYILVYRDGPLARLGHNHVMAVRQLTGREWLGADMARSGFSFSFPVTALVVDDPEARRAAGADFSTDIKEQDRDGTRKNMLRPEVLDAERYPEIKLESVRATGALPAVQLIVRITIRGVSRDVSVAATMEAIDNRLVASGEFDLQQTDFGIKPFSIGLGALEVQDRLRVRFKVSADRRKG